MLLAREPFLIQCDSPAELVTCSRSPLAPIDSYPGILKHNYIISRGRKHSIATSGATAFESGLVSTTGTMLFRRCSSERTARRRRTTSLATGSHQILQTTNNVAAAGMNATRSSNNYDNNNSNNNTSTMSTTTTTAGLVDNPGLPGAPVVDIVWPVIHPPMAPHSSQLRLQCADDDSALPGGANRDSATMIAVRAPFCEVASETVAPEGIEEERELFEAVSANETSSPPADLAVAAVEVRSYALLLFVVSCGCILGERRA